MDNHAPASDISPHRLVNVRLDSIISLSCLPKLLRELADETEAKGCNWRKGSGMGVSINWSVSEDIRNLIDKPETGSGQLNCGCRACNPKAWWMVVCDICGNKRCPHATDHKHECTNSNEPGQSGSVYA